MLNVEILFEEMQKMTKKGKKRVVFLFKALDMAKKLLLKIFFFVFFLSSNI